MTEINQNDGVRIVPNLNSLARRSGLRGRGGVDLLLEDGRESVIDLKQDNTIRIADLIYETDPYQKALTGRTPQRIEKETGIPKENIFPEGKKILYVGDPWQRMGKEIDNPNLTIIDYEYGDIASFITNNDEFRVSIERKANELLTNIERMNREYKISEKESQWMNEFRVLVEDAYHNTIDAKDLSGYSLPADAWAAAKKFIEDSYKKEIEELDIKEHSEPGDPAKYASPLSIFRTKSWYDCVYGERGFRDIPEWQNVIIPKLNEKRRELISNGVKGEELEKQMSQWKRGYIEDSRLMKVPEKANVVEAVFPELPFTNASFDRFVASWSISAHSFEHFEPDDYMKSWEEILRVLKKDGEAYIFPLQFSYYEDNGLHQALLDISKIKGVNWQLYDEYGEPTDDVEFARTLWFKKLYN